MAAVSSGSKSSSRAAGFTLVREYKATPKPGEILLISLGGSCQLYVPGRDPTWVRQLVGFLQRSDFAGAIPRWFRR